MPTAFDSQRKRRVFMDRRRVDKKFRSALRRFVRTMYYLLSSSRWHHSDSWLIFFSYKINLTVLNNFPSIACSLSLIFKKAKWFVQMILLRSIFGDFLCQKQEPRIISKVQQKPRIFHRNQKEYLILMFLNKTEIF